MIATIIMLVAVLFWIIAFFSGMSDDVQAEDVNGVSFPNLSEDEGRQYILDIFKEAEVELTPAMEAQLPTWTQVQEVVGTHPYIMGLEHCMEYQKSVPPLERMLGPAGMFNSGTNLLTHLLKRNCEIPERRQAAGPNASKESYGMRWQVPWGKVRNSRHLLCSFSFRFSFYHELNPHNNAIDDDTVWSP